VMRYISERLPDLSDEEGQGDVVSEEMS
jgi:hypothetical protein